MGDDEGHHEEAGLDPRAKPEGAGQLPSDDPRRRPGVGSKLVVALRRILRDQPSAKRRRPSGRGFPARHATLRGSAGQVRCCQHAGCLSRTRRPLSRPPRLQQRLQPRHHERTGTGSAAAMGHDGPAGLRQPAASAHQCSQRRAPQLSLAGSHTRQLHAAQRTMARDRCRPQALLITAGPPGAST